MFAIRDVWEKIKRPRPSSPLIGQSAFLDGSSAPSATLEGPSVPLVGPKSRKALCPIKGPLGLGLVTLCLTLLGPSTPLAKSPSTHLDGPSARLICLILQVPFDAPGALIGPTECHYGRPKYPSR